MNNEIFNTLVNKTICELTKEQKDILLDKLLHSYPKELLSLCETRVCKIRTEDIQDFCAYANAHHIFPETLVEGFTYSEMTLSDPITYAQAEYIAKEHNKLGEFLYIKDKSPIDILAELNLL